MKQGLAVRAIDIQRLLLRYRPNIVHFSGYGTPSSEIILEDEFGKSRPVPGEALSNLFSIINSKVSDVRCVVLNTCYSAAQAEAIAEHVDCVIGMSRIIPDEAAISFASSFYQALGFGEDVESAFRLGCQQLFMVPFGGEHAPRLIASRVDPQTIVFAKRRKITLYNRRKKPDPVVIEDREPEPSSSPPLGEKIIIVKPKNVRKNRLALSLVLLAFTCLIIGLLVAQTYKRQTTEIKPMDWPPQISTKLETELGPDAKPAERTLAQAEIDFNNQKYESVITACRGLLASKSNEPRANLLIGSAYYQLGSPQSFEYLSKALKMNQEIRLPIKHHHFDGIVKLDDGLCSGYLTFRKDGLEFHSIDRQGHDFNITPDKIIELIDESSSQGRLHLKIDGLKGGVSSIVDYNFYPPFAELRKQLTRTKAFCEEQACHESIQTLYHLLQQINKGFLN